MFKSRPRMVGPGSSESSFVGTTVRETEEQERTDDHNGEARCEREPDRAKGEEIREREDVVRQLHTGIQAAYHVRSWSRSAPATGAAAVARGSNVPTGKLSKTSFGQTL